MTDWTSNPLNVSDAAAPPPYLDDPALVEAPFAVFVWDEDLDGFAWANRAGLDRWGALSLASFRSSRLDRAMPAMGKLRDLSRIALPVEGVVQTLTFWTPRGACRMTCRCRPIDLSDDGHGLVLEAVDAPGDAVEYGNASHPTKMNGRSGYTSDVEARHRNEGIYTGVANPNDATRVPGYLSGPVDATESVATPKPTNTGADLPSPTDDDHFAMQEIARMLGRAGQTGQSGEVARSGDLSARPQSNGVVEADKNSCAIASRSGGRPNGLSSGRSSESDTGADLRLASEGHFESEVDRATEPTASGSFVTKSPSARFDTLNHELRTPLNSIIGFAEMMQREQLGSIGNPRYKEYAGDILDSARHALGLINDLLDASRVRAGHLDVTVEEIDVVELLDRVIAVMEPQSLDASVTVVRGYPPILPMLQADPRALRQILTNILTNAFKFTPGGGHVFVSTQQEADHMTIDIRDTGVGMSEEQITEALKPWVRSNGDAVLPNVPIGSGLGLPLVKALSEAQGGALSITSAPGEGTNVQVRLPLP